MTRIRSAAWVVLAGAMALAAAKSLAQPLPPPIPDDARAGGDRNGDGLPDPAPEASLPEGAEVYARGPLHEAFATPVENRAEPSAVVPKAPPEMVDEDPPDDKPEGTNVVWIPGYWAWDDDLDDYLWISGLWRDAPPGRRWVPGYWHEAAGGWQWAPGAWVLNQAEEQLTYLPQPPASLDNGPNIAAPSAQHFWVPGHWEYRDDYRWRPGYWSPFHEEWVWVPAHYVCTPGGYLFVPGYWDHQLVNRGIVYAPVRFHRPVVVTYTPVVVVNTWQNFFVHLFVSPRRRCYVYGDCYGPAYVRAGVVPCHTFHVHRRGYDPLFAHYHHVHGDAFAQRLDGWHRHYQHHAEDRPRVTFRQQQQFLASRPNDAVAQNAQLAANFKAAARAKQQPFQFTKLTHEHKVAHIDHAREIRTVARERVKFEKEPGDDHGLGGRRDGFNNRDGRGPAGRDGAGRDGNGRDGNLPGGVAGNGVAGNGSAAGKTGRAPRTLKLGEDPKFRTGVVASRGPDKGENTPAGAPLGRDNVGRDKTAGLNGPKLDGPALSGPNLNGPTLGGPKVTGPALNGPQLGNPAGSGQKSDDNRPITGGPNTNPTEGRPNVDKSDETPHDRRVGRGTRGAPPALPGSGKAAIATPGNTNPLPGGKQPDTRLPGGIGAGGSRAGGLGTGGNSAGPNTVGGNTPGVKTPRSSVSTTPVPGSQPPGGKDFNPLAPGRNTPNVGTGNRTGGNVPNSGGLNQGGLNPAGTIPGGTTPGGVPGVGIPSRTPGIGVPNGGTSPNVGRSNSGNIGGGRPNVGQPGGVPRSGGFGNPQVPKLGPPGNAPNPNIQKSDSPKPVVPKTTSFEPPVAREPNRAAVVRNPAPMQQPAMIVRPQPRPQSQPMAQPRPSVSSAPKTMTNPQPHGAAPQNRQGPGHGDRKNGKDNDGKKGR